MHSIVSVLQSSKLFNSIEILELIEEESIQLLKVKAHLKNNTILYIHELHTQDSQKYSYHWQKPNGQIIARWDNKPHWKHIKTFPYHKHFKGKVMASHRITVEEVIESIMTTRI